MHGQHTCVIGVQCGWEGKGALQGCSCVVWPWHEGRPVHWEPAGLVQRQDWAGLVSVLGAMHVGL